jgi:hypothetical protein
LYSSADFSVVVKERREVLWDHFVGYVVPEYLSERSQMPHVVLASSWGKLRKAVYLVSVENVRDRRSVVCLHAHYCLHTEELRKQTDLNLSYRKSLFSYEQSVAHLLPHAEIFLHALDMTPRNLLNTDSDWSKQQSALLDEFYRCGPSHREPLTSESITWIFIPSFPKRPMDKKL